MRKRVIVTLSDAGRERLDETVAQLKDAGLEVDSVLHGVGIVTGDTDAPSLTHFEALEGVHSAEPEGHVQLPPPESDIQ